MPHSVLTFALIDEAIGITHTICFWVVVRTQFKAEKITRCLTDDIAQLGNCLFDPFNRILHDKTVMRAANQW
jgi:hypothetical protein